MADQSSHASSASTPSGQSARSGGGGGDGNGPLPFEIDMGVIGRSDSPPSEAVMSNSESRTRWSKMMTAWGATETRLRTLLCEQVMLYFAINGASARANFNRVFRIGGRDYSSRIIHTVLGDSVRNFARANADLCRTILRQNPDIASMLAKRAGMSSEMGEIAFDFSDYCNDLNDAEREAIATWKQCTIGTSVGVPLVNRRIASNVISAAGNGGGSSATGSSSVGMGPTH